MTRHFVFFQLNDRTHKLSSTSEHDVEMALSTISRVSNLLRRVVPRGSSSPRAVAATKREYDYVIVGAGSAGCVLANELSADGSSVLLLEAGGWDWNPLVHIPAGVYSVFKDPSINWNMESEPEPSAGDRRIELPRGKVLGGSSSINACVYMRGHPRDYDRWAAEHALPEWSFDHVLPYFKRCETSDRGESDYRGGSGRLSVTQGKMDNPLYEALLEAGAQSGQGVSDDLNGYRPEGVARLDRTTTPAGRRSSAADAHLFPALARENLDLVTGAEVAGVVMEGGKAVGVRVLSGDGIEGGSGRLSLSSDDVVEIRASKCVVLSAGSIKTPQLLMLSGIGDRKELEEHGISCAVHLPGVGGNLQDHACINTAYHFKEGGDKHASLAHLSQPWHKVGAGAQWILTGGGPAASNIWEGGGLVYGQHGGFDANGEDSIDAPNLQYHFCPVFSSYDGAELSLVPGFQMQVDQLRPFSRGRVSLRSADPRAVSSPPFALSLSFFFSLSFFSVSVKVLVILPLLPATAMRSCYT